MDERQRQERQKYAGKKVPTMKRRDDEHDYTQACFYMVTMAVEGRRSLLGSIVGRAEAAEGSADCPHVQLTELGDAVREAWWSISSYYPQVAVVALQVMPDHLHGILYFREAGEIHLGQVIRGFKAGCNKAYRRLFPAATMSQPTREGQIQTAAAGIPAAFPPKEATAGIPAAFPPKEAAAGIPTAFPPKEATTGIPAVFPPKEATAGIPTAFPAPSAQPSSYAATSSRPASPKAAGLLWEKGYNDRILHNYSTLDKWKAYLRDNPRRLLVKRAHPEFFRIHHRVTYAGLTFEAMGNLFLLDYPEKIQVQCSRSITPEALQAKTEAAITAGKRGAVFVSPTISQGEKDIMNAIYKEGFPVIYLRENGFGEKEKPGGRLFDACARGQMLILAPWEHHNEQTTIRRDQCLALNEMARLICEQQQ
ncbi:MAG: hypothetical protein II949_00770 [Prevotella sp.]|nr:hypothetical protein [Prevotella sp.]